MEGIQQSMAQLTDTFNKKFAEFEVRQQKLSAPSTSTLSTLEEEFLAFKTFTLNALRALQTQVELISLENDRLEMHSRRKILLIHGVPEQQKEDTLATVVETIVSKLKLMDFNTSNISRCHRMGKTFTPERSRPILLKLCDMNLRSKVWAAKTSLKGSGITLSEFLTKRRHDIFMSARQRFGVTRCWTRDGCVYVQGSDGVRHRVEVMSDLDALAKTTMPEDAAQKRAQTGKDTKESAAATRPKRVAANKK